jgi:hypothetical protein
MTNPVLLLWLADANTYSDRKKYKINTIKAWLVGLQKIIFDDAKI